MTARQFDARFLERLRDTFATQLPGFLPSQRWFGAKARRIQAVQLADCIPIRMEHGTALIALAAVQYEEGPAETYVLPLLLAPSQSRSEEALRTRVVKVPDPNSTGEIVLTDAFEDSEFLAELLRATQAGVSYLGSQGELQAKPTNALGKILSAAGVLPAGRRSKAEQSNTSVIYGESLILKFFRRLAEGINPDLEIGLFLTEQAHFANVPALAGSLEYHTREGKTSTLGMLQGFVANRGDAWRHTLASLSDFLADADARLRSHGAQSAELSAFRRDGVLPAELAARLNEQADWAGLLGRRTAELHLALASGDAESDFSPEPFTAAFQESLKRSIHDMVVRNFSLLRAKADSIPEAVRAMSAKALELEDDVLLACHAVLEREIHATRTRIHGDYHLGQVLFTGSDFFIIDFEGEPARPLAARRAKRSPLQDVAGMLRSFQYAARSALVVVNGKAGEDENSRAFAEQLATRWQVLASTRFLEEYREAAKGASFLPADAGEFEALLRLHLLEKVVYELGYELNNRPDWLMIPLHGILELARKKEQKP